MHVSGSLGERSCEPERGSSLARCEKGLVKLSNEGFWQVVRNVM